jgi:hypothetical protein
MAEDSGASPLPRRTPGERRGPRSGRPATPLVLPEDLVQRIVAALEGTDTQESPQNPPASPPRPAEEHQAPSQRPSSRPRRLSIRMPPSAPPVARAPSLPRLPSAEAASATEPLQAIPTAGARGTTEEVGAQLHIDVPPEPATAAPADHTLIPAQYPAEQRPDQQTRENEKAASPEKVPAPRVSAQARAEKTQARWAKARTGLPKEAVPKATARPPTTEPSRGPGRRPKTQLEARGRRHGVTTGVILAVVLLSAGSLAFLLTRHAVASPAAHRHRTGPTTAAAVRDRAASWVANQVSPTTTVSCDRVMCQTLKARGVPAGSVLELRPGKAAPLRSGVIIVTSTVRTMVGSRHMTADAPVAIASFGSGNMRIDIREIAPHGAAAYSSALRADIRARKLGGTLLLDSPLVTMSATARRQLAAGQVDARLLVVIVSLAAHRPVSIVAFGDLPPGASPGIPLRSADLSAAVGTTGLKSATDLQWMSDFLRTQHGLYRATHITMVQATGGRNVLRIEFPAPSPFGLLNAKAPGS